MPSAIKKIIYLFFSVILGSLIFFIIHRVVIFFYLLAVTWADATISANNFLLWDFGTLIAAIFAGGVYGLWLGKYWYGIVYHEKIHGGLTMAVGEWVWNKASAPRQVRAFGHKLEAVTQKLEHNLWELEDLTKQAPILAKPRKIVRKKITRAPKFSVSPKVKVMA